jgi:signal transduction histidine kinase
MVLAAVFLLAIWLDPTQPHRYATAAYGLLGLYLVTSAILFIFTWADGWMDWKLAVPSHCLDVATFALLVFLTDGYTSPFFTHFIFIILSATIRWGWRETAITAGACVFLFFFAGFAELYVNSHVLQVQRVMMRGTYLVVLSGFLIWIGINQRPFPSEPLRKLKEQENLPGEGRPPVRQLLNYAASNLGARRLLFVWSENEEPWINVAELKPDGFSQQRFAPETFTSPVRSDLSGWPFMFRRTSNEVLISPSRARRKIVRAKDAVDPHFAERFQLEEGLVLPVSTNDYTGHLFAVEVPGLCADDLVVGYQVGREMSQSIERSSFIQSSEEAAEARASLSLSRDIHDGVIQVLAGTTFRLEGLLKSSEEGRNIRHEVKQLQQELSQQQRSLRSTMDALRSGHGAAHHSDVHPALSQVADQLARLWKVDCHVEKPRKEITAPAWVQHDLHQLVREAVANAVRHGKAQRVFVAMHAGEGTIHVLITDNGRGFSANDKGDGASQTPGGPWSLAERVKNVGGSLAIVSSDRGSRLSITLPLAESR